MTGMFPATSMPDRDWWEVLWPEPSGLLLSLGIEPGMTALDLCCGDGYFTAPLAKIVGGRVYGLDLDPDMIVAAKAEVERRGVSVLEWIVADAGEVAELVPEKIDFVLMANTFHGVPDKPALIKVVARVLKPRGLFALVNWHQRPREQTTVLGKPRGPGTEMRMSPEAMVAVLEANGFQLLRMVDLPPYHYGAVFEHRE
ncbi:class I SAM-dependent methyltransferase [Mesorhizobium sp. B2-4-17]|uniref:class I SAM-dependent methyltransferase n=1 Tax=Mesorhizobium sp. B2-4-17 TaxID=2589932 RepID=UPI001126C137|nr:class I SAM-dependent methyltransferase [Mesorhizobium sp. B2-4-17]TPK83004.1 class I SAM-dependent methyltransferase [Mesorhizobium sp. B2-4-17]